MPRPGDHPGGAPTGGDAEFVAGIGGPGREGRPRVLVPRPGPDDPLCRALADAGFDVVPVALTVTVPAPESTRGRALDALRAAAWLVLTSPTAVRVLRATAEEAGTTLARLVAATPGLRVAAVGRGTARALAAADVRVDLAPAADAENAAGLADACPHAPPPRGLPAGGPVAGEVEPLRRPIRPSGPPGAVSDDPARRTVAEAARHVVLPASALASPALAQGLRSRGWEVTGVPMYTTATVAGDTAEAARAAIGAWPEVVVLTAGSGARALVEVLGAPPGSTAVAVIGEPTARVCAALAIRVDAVAASPAPEDVAAAAVAAHQAALR